MKPTPLTDQTRRLLYAPEAFVRADESDDSVFYAADRPTSHLDETARRTVTELIGALVREERSNILDLMSSWDSHLPEDLRAGRAVGLGLNDRELAANPRLTERVRHDLNRQPRLPFADEVFDVVLNTVSVDYLVHRIRRGASLGLLQRRLSPAGAGLGRHEPPGQPRFLLPLHVPPPERLRRHAPRAQPARAARGRRGHGGCARPRVIVLSGNDS